MWNQFLSSASPFIVMSILIGTIHPAFAQSTTIAPEEHLGEMAIPEAIKGFDEQKVKEDPICDSSKRPEIVTVDPDEVHPGDKIVITGHYFGKKKECLFRMTIGSEKVKDLQYISDQKLEVTAKYIASVTKKLSSEFRVKIIQTLAEVIKSDTEVSVLEIDFFNSVAEALKATPAELIGLSSV